MIPKYFLTSKKIRDLLKEHESYSYADCNVCGGEGSLELNQQYEYTTPDGKHTIVLPAWECNICKEMHLNKEGLLKLAEHFKKPYEQVQIDNLVVTRRVIH